MSDAQWIIDDALSGLRSLPDSSVDLVLTSPPFLALRSYLDDDHPRKADEIGLEPGPGEYVDVLMRIVEECDRVLAPHGSLVLELGDTYAGSGGAGGDYRADYRRAGQNKWTSPQARQRDKSGSNWPMRKSLTLVPEMVRFAMAYGYNPITARATDKWRIRNVVRWVRPNPPVGALGDKFRPATSDMVVACKSATRYFDLDAVREPGGHAPTRRVGNKAAESHLVPMERGETRPGEHPAGAPPLDYWEVSTGTYTGSHYAVWPRELLNDPILSMCPDVVCRSCGEPSRRIVDSTRVASDGRELGVGEARYHGGDDGGSSAAIGERHPATVYETVGWSDCDCQDHCTAEFGCPEHYRRGVVLDPFAGSGTTLEVATGHGRDAIGIDIDERNEELARQRVGMFLTTREGCTDAT